MGGGKSREGNVVSEWEMGAGVGFIVGLSMASFTAFVLALVF